MTNNKRVIRIKDVMRRESESYMEEFDGYHMIVYVALQSFYNPGIEANMTTVGTISQMTGLTSTAHKNRIKESILDLKKWDLINITSEQKSFGNNDMIVVTIPFMGDDRFTSLNAEFCMQILTSNLRADTKGSTLLLYAVLAQYTGEKEYCFPSIDTLANEVGVSTKTVYSLLDGLQNFGVLICDNNGVRQLSNGTFARSNNIYVMNDIPNAKEILSAELSKISK